MFRVLRYSHRIFNFGVIVGETFSSAEFANLAAGVVVEKVGTATASPEEILKHL